MSVCNRDRFIARIMSVAGVTVLGTLAFIEAYAFYVEWAFRPATPGSYMPFILPPIACLAFANMLADMVSAKPGEALWPRHRCVWAFVALLMMAYPFAFGGMWR